jgi:hypothetical protein
MIHFNPEFRVLGYKNPVRTSQETHYISATEPNPLILSKIWDSNCGDYEECQMGCLVLYEPMFRMNVASRSVRRLHSLICVVQEKTRSESGGSSIISWFWETIQRISWLWQAWHMNRHKCCENKQILFVASSSLCYILFTSDCCIYVT